MEIRTSFFDLGMDTAACYIDSTARKCHILLPRVHIGAMLHASHFVLAITPFLRPVGLPNYPSLPGLRCEPLTCIIFQVILRIDDSTLSQLKPEAMTSTLKYLLPSSCRELSIGGKTIFGLLLLCILSP